jgi:hypothetical protein
VPAAGSERGVRSDRVAGKSEGWGERIGVRGRVYDKGDGIEGGEAHGLHNVILK